MKNSYFNRDLSWLLFNERVMQEAARDNVPVYERIKFLAIFSSNLDEFFRVRIPVIRALQKSNLHNKLNEEFPADLSEQVLSKVHDQQKLFGNILNQKLIPELKKNNIHFYYGEEIPNKFKAEIAVFFRTRILSYLQIIHETQDNIELENNALYLLVNLQENSIQKLIFSIINIPTDHLPRFYIITEGEETHLFFIDDIIKNNLELIFQKHEIKGCFSIKITRNAEIEYQEFADEDFAATLEKQLEKRNHGLPTRFLFDEELPEDLLLAISKKLNLTKKELFKGGRYHNLKDLAQLPNPGLNKLEYENWQPLPHLKISDESVFSLIEKSDQLVHLPYQSYDIIFRFFNEAAVDKDVTEIFITLYRVAADSQIANTLISAAKNGKNVYVFVELKARFDEANNIKWAKKMKAAGVKIIYSRADLKIHAKIALIHKKTGLKNQYYGMLATGNFNETTAKFYTDHALLTADKSITQELDLLFAYLQAKKSPKEYQFLKFKHILVSQFNLQNHFLKLIEREINHVKNGNNGEIIIKLNNLQDLVMIDALYKAGQEGVKIKMIIRGICCLIPEKEGLSENISVIRIVDRYLEHSRIFWFNNNGNDEIYLGSADWMSRNLYKRIEVAFKVEHLNLKAQLKQVIDFQLADNMQAVKLLPDYEIEEIKYKAKKVRAQQATRTYLTELE